MQTAKKLILKNNYKIKAHKNLIIIYLSGPVDHPITRLVARFVIYFIYINGTPFQWNY